MAQEDTAHRYLPLSFVDLKKECQKRGLDTGGTKDNLIKRLVIQDTGGGPKRSPSSPSLNETEKTDRVDPKSARSTAISPRLRAAEIDSQMTKGTSSSRSPEITAARRRSSDKLSRSKTASAISREGREERRDEEKEKKASSSKERDRKTPPLSPKKSSVIEPRKQRESGEDKEKEKDDKDKERSSRGESDRETKEHRERDRDRDRDRMLSPAKERGSRTSPKEPRDKKEKKVPRESPRGVPERPASPNLASNPAFSPPPLPPQPQVTVTTSSPGPRPQTVHFTSPRSNGIPSSNSMNNLSSQSGPTPAPPITASQPIPPIPTAHAVQNSPKGSPKTPHADLGASIHALPKVTNIVPTSAAKVTSATPPMSPTRSPSRTYLNQEIVYLSCQGLKDEDAFRVAQEMQSETCKTRELLLGGNAISSHGGVAIAKSLEKNISLRRLVLGDNPMGDVAGTAFATALRSNTTLQELGLSNTALSNASARAFSAVRPINLQRLVLQGNGMISAEGGRALLDLVVASASILELDLRHTEVLPEVIEEITKVLRARRNASSTNLLKAVPPPTASPAPGGESPRPGRKGKMYPARTVTAVIEEGVLSAMPLLVEISPQAVVLHYAPAAPRAAFVRSIPLHEAKNFYGKGNDLRFTWRIRGQLQEEVFECEKAAKIAKRLMKWTQRRAEEEAKQRKREAELLKDSSDSSSPAKGDSGKNLSVTVKEDKNKDKSLIRAFSQSKLSQLVAGSVIGSGSSDKPNAKDAPGVKAGHGSMRPQPKHKGDLLISRPTSMVHKTHVDRDLVWTGESEFQLAEKIGGGAFATVYRAIHESGLVLAIKVVNMGRSQHDQLRTEVDLLKRCSDHNIVRLYGTIQKDDFLWILMDYCACGSALDLMKTLKRTLTEEEIGVFFINVLKGLAYLHREGIVHRDLKSANILISDNLEAKIADFGVSAQIGNMLSKRQSVVGTPLFMSPETLDGAKPDAKSDIWSLGIMAIELAEGDPPYSGEHVLRAMKMICTEPPPRLKEQSRWSETFHSFLAACLRTAPSDRPTAVELLAHPFIQQAVSSGATQTVPVRLATEIGLTKRSLTENHHTHQSLKFSMVVEEKDGMTNPKASMTRPRSVSTERDRIDKIKDDIEVRGTSNELPWETLSDEKYPGEHLTRQLSGGRVSSPRDAPLHISSPFSIVSAGELREKLEKSEKRNVDLEQQVADLKKQLAKAEKELSAEKQWTADLGQLLGGVLELRVAADKLERDFKGFLAKRGT